MSSGICVYTGALVHIVEESVLVRADIFCVGHGPHLLKVGCAFIIRFTPNAIKYIESEEEEATATHTVYLTNHPSNWWRDDIGVAVVTNDSLFGELR